MSDDVTRLAEVLAATYRFHAERHDFAVDVAETLLASEWLAERDALNRLLGAMQAQSDAIDAHAELVARLEALCAYAEKRAANPSARCMRAVDVAAELRAVLNDPTEETK